MVKKTFNVICAKVKTSTLDESFDNDKCTWQTSTGIKPRKTLWEYSRVKFVATSIQYFFILFTLISKSCFSRNSSPRPSSCGLRESIRCKRSYNKEWSLQHDNTPFSTFHGYTKTWMSFAIFHLFTWSRPLRLFFSVPQEKFWLKGYNFDMIKEIQKETQVVFVTFTLEDN